MTADFLSGLQTGVLCMASFVMLAAVVYAAVREWWRRRHARPRWMTELSADDATRGLWLDELERMR